MEKSKTQKGRELLLINGFRYRKARDNTDGSTSWRCAEGDCKGRLKTLNDITTIITNHYHAPNPGKNEALKSVAEMKTRAKETSENPRQIIQQCTNLLSLEAATQLPQYSSTQRTIQRVRNQEMLPYPTPATTADIQIPLQLRNTTRDEAFLLWDSGANDPNRFFMFGTEENLNILENHRHWFVDGTFKVSPELFFQVFTIHSLVDTRCLPLVYVLLKNKLEDNYVRVFEILRELKPTLNPQSVLSDYEKGIQNAVARVFINTEIVGCLFHLGQSLWRKVQDLQLAQNYINSENIRVNIKMLLALSFVPPRNVVSAFEDLVEICPDELNELVDYWEDNYIGRQRRNRRSEPRFLIQIWNMYDRVVDGLPRTNNSVEGWHHAFQKTVDCHHPSIFKLIDHFRQEQNTIELFIQRYNSGVRAPEASKKKYAELNRRLKTLVANYINMNILDYLRGIAHNLEL